MIDPDAYFEDSLEKQRLRASLKFPRHVPNLHKLSLERQQVPIVLEVPVRPGLTLRDRFDWDLSDDHKSPFLFAKQLTERLGLPPAEEQRIATSILDQVIEHIEKYTVQTRTRLPRRLDDQSNSGLSCLQCGSVLYSDDICRACGVSLEKLRQKYGNLLAAADSKEPEEAVRQTERQRTLEKSRRLQDPNNYGASKKKTCGRCGEGNHPLSIECRQCNKPLPKHSKRAKTRSESLAYTLWRMLNRDSQFAQMVLLNDTLKEEDFSSAQLLRTQLRDLLIQCEYPPVSASSLKVKQMLDLLESAYECILMGTYNLSASQSSIPMEPQPQLDVTELDVRKIHTPINETPAYLQIASVQQEFAKKFIKNEVPGARKRGRPRKYPAPETVAHESIEQPQEQNEVKMKEPDDNSMNECGVCSEPGELLCCEVCPSVYHMRCLGLTTAPKGRWMCFFCRIVRDGVKLAMLEERLPQREQVSILMNPVQGLKNQALQILSLLTMHPCARDLCPVNPRVEIPPSDLASVKLLVKEGHYQNLEDIDSDIRNIWKASMKTYKRVNLTIYQQIFNMQLFHNKILSELSNYAGLQVNTQPINIPQMKGDPQKKLKVQEP